MITAEILKPVVALAAWTLLMWVWMYATRIPAIQKGKVMDGSTVGTTGSMLRTQLPDRVSWKADNYNHLHEAPTVFYAIAIVLALIGQGNGVNAAIAWAYVGLRIVHSIWQATINRVMVRFALFALSSLALMALVLHASLAIFH